MRDTDKCDLIAVPPPSTQNNVPGESEQLRSPELLVLAAEAAVKNGEFTSAREACHEFFLDGGGARDQFYCRALFVKVPCYRSPPTSLSTKHALGCSIWST